MNKIKFIKTQEDYQEALELMKKLMLRDPEPESDEGEQLSLLNALIQDYESRSVSESLPNPVDAIKFRMEQANLKPVDLVPYIGSRSRVSEILSGKRQLTLEMVRALEVGLGIPAKVLIKKPENAGADDEVGYNSWDNKLIAEMETYGYFGKDTIKSKSKIDLLKSFFSLVNLQSQVVGMMRKTHYRSSPLTDKRALYAWLARVIQKTNKIKIDKKYQEGSINLEFMQNMVKLSVESNGIFLVQKKLKEIGVILIIEPHLSKTYLDGATILVNKNNPVIGLTIRHDRLDNFWFTLMHELAHLALHFNQNISLFYDELEGVKTEIDEKEKEADDLAEEALMPKAKWEVSPARLIPSVLAASSLAKELGVHTAIIAGQIRHKGNKYVYLNKIVNEAKVRQFFTDIKWK